MKTTTSIRIDKETLQTAQELGINISKACETALKQYIIAFRTANEELKCRGWDLIPRSPGISPGERLDLTTSPGYESGALTRLGYPGSAFISLLFHARKQTVICFAQFFLPSLVFQGKQYPPF